MQSGVQNMTPFLPFVVLGCGVVAALLASAFARDGRVVLLLAAAALAAALASLLPLANRSESGTLLFLIDSRFCFVSGLILFSSLCTAALAGPYLAARGERQQEFQVLLLIASFGGIVLAGCSHFASLFLGVEIVSIPLIALSAYLRDHEPGTEAGFKYLILSGVSSAVLLFGMALLYADTGSLSFASGLAAGGAHSPLFLAGAALLAAGLLFKLAVVPFHFWAPDVFTGAPAPSVVFAATASKAASIAVLLRLFPPGTLAQDRFLLVLFASTAVLSMLLGNLFALTQRNIKRMLAYSTIAHNGYVLVAFIAAGPMAIEAVLLYLASTVLTNLAAFGPISLLSDGSGDADDLDNYAGLSWHHPWTAAVLSAGMVSLIGVPPTAGFVAKFAILAAGYASAQLVLVLVLAAAIMVGAVYGLRVLMVLFSGRREPGVAAPERAAYRVPLLPALLLSAAVALIFWIGIAPQSVLRLAGLATN